MTLCNYLLAMREYFRWESGLAPDAAPDRRAVSGWVAERESRWERLVDAPFEPLALSGRAFDPFDESGINVELRPAGWVYGVAHGPRDRPHFFLGRRIATYARDGLDVVEVGEEFARDIHAAPAAYREGTIVLRRDAFERWLWSSAEGWNAARGEGPMRAALAAYGWHDDRRGAIARRAGAQHETLLRYLNTNEAAACVDAFMNAEFEGGRHQGRIDKIDAC